MQFNWNFDNGHTSTQTNPIEIFTNNGIIDSVYSVLLISETKHGCTDTSNQSIVVHPDPVAQFNPNPSSACAPFTIDSSIINLVQYPSANHLYT